MPAEQDNAERLRTIGQVVQLLSDEFSDITHSSLRFLDREGLISPERTAGRHRLFPPSQIERVRLIKKWQRQRLSLEEIKSRLEAADRLPDLNAISRRFLELLIRGDRKSAQELILQTDDAGVALDAMFDEVFRPALRETGKRWASGAITVGQEKEISAFVRDVIAHLASRHRPEEQSQGLAVVAACVEGEYHELGLRMLTVLLRREGYVVYYLGPNVSREFLIERVRARQPAAVMLAVARSELLPALSETIAALYYAEGIDHQPAVIVGGAGVPEDWRPDGVDRTVVVVGDDFNQVLDKVDRVLQDELAGA